MNVFHGLGRNRLGAVLTAAFVMSAGACMSAPPRIVSSHPADGDTDVDPGLELMEIVFDQDMQERSQSICGGGPTFPVNGATLWLDPRTVVLPVKLRPHQAYALSVNCPSSSRATRSIRGESAEQTPIRFRSGAGGKPRPALDAATNERASRLLRKAIESQYSYRDRVVSDWAGLFAANGPALRDAPTPREFAERAASILAEARDVHVRLRCGDLRIPVYRPATEENFDPVRAAGTVPDYKRVSPLVSTGTLRAADGALIGYVAVNGWLLPEKQLEAAFAFVSAMQSAGAAGMIVDVRANGGGDEPLARRFAAQFIREAGPYAKHRYRDVSSDEGWTAWRERTIKPEEAPAHGGKRTHFGAPVVVLQGRRCFSSNESFLLMMRERAGAVLMGSPSGGSSGNPKPFALGNGVVVELPSWDCAHLNGDPIEGTGIQPDVPVNWPDVGDTDPVIEKALEVLASRTHT